MAKEKTLKPVADLYFALIMFFVVAATVYAVMNFTGILSQAAKGGRPENNAPSGGHYNLNIIGVPKNKSVNFGGGQGHRIFVFLSGKTKINLTEGNDFQVLDANGTDGQAAFQLPNPDPDNDGTTRYSVWARALGKPGGKSTTTTCALDADGTQWCSIYNMVLVRQKGKSKFNDVSNELLYIYADLDDDGKVERYPLFDQTLLDYFWNYDNQGLKLAQLRFYPEKSNVGEPGSSE